MSAVTDILKSLLPLEYLPKLGGSRALKSLFGLLEDDQISEDSIVDVRTERVRHKKILRLLRIQEFTVAGLVVFLIFAIPVLRPIHKYMGRPDGKDPFALASMTEPNLTDQAVLSWSVLTITEVLTFGFGDMDRRILSQRNKFTSEGWESFLKGFVESSFYSRFKGNQLVLTTVPTDAPVIVGKGMEGEEYIWLVEMPIIMTYATVDNIAHKRRSIVQLTISRISPSQNVRGLGIKKWAMQ